MSIVAQKKPPLSETHPELAKQWSSRNTFGAAEVTYGSTQKIWWIGGCGHEWEAIAASRIKGCGCPYCSGRYAITGTNDLATINPELAIQWSPRNTLTPREVTIKSSKKVWWVCAERHEWAATVANRTLGNGCPYCINKKVLVGYNDLAKTHPTLSTEWSPYNTLTPQEISAGARKKVWWVCDKGHEWEAAIYSRASGRGCPYCASKILTRGLNDLATTNPELTAQWSTKNKQLPQEIFSHSNKKAQWVCEKGHEWEAVIASRTAGRGCPVCANNGISKIETQLINYLAGIYKVIPQYTIWYMDGKKRIILDGYIEQEDARVAFEYDGAYWHRGLEVQDSYKTSILLEQGYWVVRVRETPLPLLDIEGEGLLQLEYTHGEDILELVRRIQQAIDERESETIDTDGYSGY